ncbi:spermidine synthase [Nonomuraea glycinis]|uniref:spermidine synthase n=1 Tax=Nonomuraea glycinis TaxID=2047744 RepID=UPI00339E6AB5
MSVRFEELDWRPTPLGDLSLRRRREPVLGTDVHEIKLGDDFLMSSLFTEAEIQLARLGLAALDHDALDVAVGGLGLGYTARSVLEDTRVRSLVVIDALPEVIEWHERGLLPLGPGLTGDARCRFAHGDFFAMAATPAGLDPESPGRRFHAILVDIDHAPDHVLHPGHAAFYRPDGLRGLARHLHPGGVFALWSNDPPSEEFNACLEQVFDTWQAHVVTFPNHLQGRPSTNTVYVAKLG